MQILRVLKLRQNGRYNWRLDLDLMGFRLQIHDFIEFMII
jgi:hypothetical protein